MRRQQNPTYYYKHHPARKLNYMQRLYKQHEQNVLIAQGKLTKEEAKNVKPSVVRDLAKKPALDTAIKTVQEKHNRILAVKVNKVKVEKVTAKKVTAKKDISNKFVVKEEPRRAATYKKKVVKKNVHRLSDPGSIKNYKKMRERIAKDKRRLSNMDFIYNNFSNEKINKKDLVNQLEKKLMQKKQAKVLKYWSAQRKLSATRRRSQSYYDKLYSLFPNKQHNHRRYARKLKSCKNKKCVKRIARKLNYMQWLYETFDNKQDAASLKAK